MNAIADAQAVAPQTALSGARLDRAAKLRTEPGEVARLLRSRDARAVFVEDDAVLVAADGSALARSDLPEPTDRVPLLLGLEPGGALFGVDLEWLDDRRREELARSGRLVPLREAALRLSPDEGGMAAYLVALSNWHRHHTHCPNCGAATEVTEGGLSRLCPRCGRAHFPRTDPVVIMLVEHDGRLLLGRRPVWPRGRYSLLAGFVAPGETPEEAVAREVREESEIEVVDSRYVASQPWPFPASLMLGYSAAARGGIPRCMDGELDDVRWFTRQEIRAASRDSTDWSTMAADRGPGLLLPPPVSIARSLIEWWHSGEIPRLTATAPPLTGPAADRPHADAQSHG